MRFEGILPAVTTPFAAAGDVDLDALAANVAALLDAGVHGLVATGTMGEAGSLSREERRDVVAAVVAAAGGRGPVVAGVSSATAALAGTLGADAAAAGADAVMCLPPLGYRADERELEAFYGAVAETAGLPLMVYNNPEASGVDLSPATLLRLHDAVEALAAIKECSGDARRIAALLDPVDGPEVLVGGDDWALEGFCAGATGWVTGVAVVAPSDCVELWERCRAGELAAARAVYRRLLPLARFDMTPKLVQYFKAAMDAVGYAGGPARPPRLALAEDERAALDAALAALRVPA
jgi:dihydrodipicolinate synthase/N-acetylneuraminate lyase